MLKLDNALSAINSINHTPISTYSTHKSDTLQKVLQECTPNEKASFNNFINRDNYSDDDKLVILKMIRVLGANHTHKLLYGGKKSISIDLAHKMFDKFMPSYNEDFVDFFNRYYNFIIKDPDMWLVIADIHRDFINDNPTIKKFCPKPSPRFSEIRRTFQKGVPFNYFGFNRDLARLAYVCNYSEEIFRELCDISEQSKKVGESSISHIKGAHSFDNTGNRYEWEVLSRFDPLNLTIGRLVDNCFQYGKEAQNLMISALTAQDIKPFVLRKDGEVIAISCLWRNINVLCFHNIEISSGVTKDEINESEIAEIYSKVANEIVQKESTTMDKLLIKGLINDEIYKSKLDTVIIEGYSEGYDIFEHRRNKHPGIDIGKYFKKSNLSVMSPDEKERNLYSSKYPRGNQYYIIGEGNTIRSDNNANNPIIYRDEPLTQKGLDISPELVGMIKAVDSKQDNPKMQHIWNTSSLLNYYKKELLQHGIRNYDQKELVVGAYSDWFVVYIDTKDKVEILDFSVIKDEKSIIQVEQISEYLKVIAKNKDISWLSKEVISEMKRSAFLSTKNKLMDNTHDKGLQLSL